MKIGGGNPVMVRWEDNVSCNVRKVKQKITRITFRNHTFVREKSSTSYCHSDPDENRGNPPLADVLRLSPKTESILILRGVPGKGHEGFTTNSTTEIIDN
jgi:hypothetical protein